MKPQVIEAKRLEDAVRLFQEKPDISWYVSGGTHLLKRQADSFRGRIIPLREMLDQGIAFEGNRCTIGAGTTFEHIIETEAAPGPLKEACRNAASRTLRCMATIGGNIAAAREDSYLNHVLTALGAEVELFTLRQETERMKVEEYIADKDACRGAVILRVGIPDCSLQVVHRRSARSSQGKAAVSIAVSAAQDTVIAASASSCGLVRLSRTESYARNVQAADQQEVLKLVAEEFIPSADITGSAEYKQYLAGVLIARALEELQGGGRGANTQ